MLGPPQLANFHPIEQQLDMSLSPYSSSHYPILAAVSMISDPSVMVGMKIDQWIKLLLTSLFVTMEGGVTAIAYPLC